MQRFLRRADHLRGPQFAPHQLAPTPHSGQRLPMPDVGACPHKGHAPAALGVTELVQHAWRLGRLGVGVPRTDLEDARPVTQAQAGRSLSRCSAAVSFPLDGILTPVSSRASLTVSASELWPLTSGRPNLVTLPSGLTRTA